MVLSEMEGNTRQNIVHLGVLTDATVGGVYKSAAFAQKARELEQSYLGVADRTIKNFPDFQEACEAVGIKPIFGVRLPIIHPLDAGKAEVMLLADELAGLGNLSLLLQISDKRVITREDLFLHQNGLRVFADSLSYPQVVEGINSLRLHYQLTPWNLESDLDIARTYSANTVALYRAWRVDQSKNEDLWLSAILQARNQKLKLSKNNFRSNVIPAKFGENFPPDGYLRNQAEMMRIYGPELSIPLYETGKIAENITIYKLPKIGLPKYPVKKGDSAINVLTTRVDSRMPYRFDNITPKIKKRIADELKTIQEKEDEDIFLFADEFSATGRINKIPIVAIGSSNCSAVNFVLGITNVDPIANDLPFERFLNSFTKKKPDIDWLIDSENRDQNMALVEQKVGEMGLYICNIVTSPKYGKDGAIREVMRVFGYNEKTISKIQDLLFEQKFIDEEYQSLIALAEEMQKREINRNTSPQHPSKIIMLDTLDQAGFMIRKTEKGTILVIDKSQAEYVINFDYVSSNALRLIARVCEKVGIDRDKIKFPNGLIEDVFMHPEGIPFLETPWLKQVLWDYYQAAKKAKKVLTPADIISAISLSRPGARQSLGEYLYKLAKSGVLIKPKADDFLAETFGLIIYQEQVLEIAKDIAGFSGEDAEELRRAMTKERTPEQFEALRHKFLHGSISNGYREIEAERLFTMIAEFAKYGFLKGHAISLVNNICLIAAYLKLNYPDEFFKQVSKQRTNVYFYLRQPEIYIQELKRIKLLKYSR
jgi:DNA polymerase III subunit alpha